MAVTLLSCLLRMMEARKRAQNCRKSIFLAFKNFTLTLNWIKAIILNLTSIIRTAKPDVIFILTSTINQSGSAEWKGDATLFAADVHHHKWGACSKLPISEISSNHRKTTSSNWCQNSLMRIQRGNLYPGYPDHRVTVQYNGKHPVGSESQSNVLGRKILITVQWQI